MQETWVRSLGWEDPLEKEMETHSNILAWKTPWTIACQAPPSMGFSRQEYWSGVPLPSPGDLPYPGIKPGSPALWADVLSSKPPGKQPEITPNSQVGIQTQFKYLVCSIPDSVLGEVYIH